MSSSSTPTGKAPNNEWWRSGVIYQIYPRSFADSNGDGIGDLPGITQRLEHIAGLGADALWLSPIFTSPMKDFGYDVSDYNDIDPMFGTLADFKALVERAHALGLKVIIDQVLSHCSDQHPWFIESRSSCDNPRADWYVWADAKDDGTPPNNWLSVFGGSSWQWDTRRKQYYLHNFLASQPDLNFHNPLVQDALLASVKFWLDFGVDGYRLDAINFCFHDAELRSNPGTGEPDGSNPTVSASNPYAWQQHLYDRSRPDALGFLERMRALTDQYPDTMMVGEIGDESGMVMVAQYSSQGPQGQDRLHMGYCFDPLADRHDAPYIHGVIDKFERVAPTPEQGWACWALSNHDCKRLATRWGGPNPHPALLRLAPALQLSLRGAVCLYQGEELGLPEADIAFEDLQDPYGITMWPEFKGRDGCRTPFPWAAAAPDLGFGPATGSASKPWLPVAESHRTLAVDAQEADPGALLHHYRHLLRWRRTRPELMHGSLQLLPQHPQVLAYVREYAGSRLLCAFNLSEQPATLALAADQSIATLLSDSGASGATPQPGAIRFDPYGVLFARLA
jgi:alpha-glucosidase